MLSSVLDAPAIVLQGATRQDAGDCPFLSAAFLDGELVAELALVALYELQAAL